MPLLQGMMLITVHAFIGHILCFMDLDKLPVDLYEHRMHPVTVCFMPKSSQLDHSPIRYGDAVYIQLSYFSSEYAQGKQQMFLSLLPPKDSNVKLGKKKPTDLYGRYIAAVATPLSPKLIQEW